MMTLRRIAVIAAVLFAWRLPPAAALEPEQLLLIVNRNVPEGRALAQFYAKARLVPDNRIVELDLPASDEIPFATYERDVVTPLRTFLREHSLQKKVTCLVTFYGVPLRIAARKNSPQEAAELTELRRQLAETTTTLKKAVDRLESAAVTADLLFEPQPGDAPQQVLRRAEAAMQCLAAQVDKQQDEAKRKRDLDALVAGLRELRGPAGILRLPVDEPAQRQKTYEQVQKAQARLQELQELRNDPAARKELRDLVHDLFGLLDYVRALEAQSGYLVDQNSGAALDSELALLWWKIYPRTMWVTNPLLYSSQAPLERLEQILMVSRLDAPESATVREMVLASLKAERDGLTGRMVIDSRGIAPGGANAAYASYDQTLRNLAKIVGSSAKLPLKLEDSERLLPANSANNVALYCGWYSVRNYVQCCQFNPGAVAFHVASFELVSLHDKNEKGWCAGLLRDGAAATLGPVAEPYLSAFPPADEFFPVLMTGKLTLAETYWRTSPMASWQMALLGDPLYNPYRAKPLLRVEDLPQKLQAAVVMPALVPTTAPAADR